MSPIRSVLLLALLAAAGLLLLSGPAAAQTPAPPSCPVSESGAPATPAPGTPAAPSDLDRLGQVLSWNDNAADEDGFLICVSSARPGSLLEFVVGPDVTSFVVPEDAPPQCPPAPPGDEFATYGVYAFNGRGLSAASSTGVVIECVSGPAATALAEAGPTALPDTGGATRDAGSPRLLWGVLALAAGTLIGAGALGIRRFKTR